MILRGLAVAVSGFLFIFAPGLPLGLLARRSPPYRREFIYWGIGLWLLMLLPSLFLQSLLRQILFGEAAPGEPAGAASVALVLPGALLTALFVQLAMLVVLRWRGREQAARPPDGMALGFGAGLMVQVLTGLNLVGAGFSLMFGDASTPTLASLARASALSLGLSLLALVLFRPAQLVVRALQGFLVGRSIREGWRFFWLAALVDTLFVSAILGMQRILGGEDPGAALLGEASPLTALGTSLYYLAAFLLAYLWLTRQLAAGEGQADPGPESGRRGARRARPGETRAQQK